MLLALLASLSLAQGLGQRPISVTSDDVLAELDRLSGLGFDEVSLQTQSDELREVLQVIANQRPAQVIAAALCAIGLWGSPDAIEAWLIGSCVPRRLSAAAIARFERLNPYTEVEPPPRVLADLGLPRPGVIIASHPGRVKLGTKLMLIGGTLVGASYGLYALSVTTDGASDGAWASMVGVNTVGWIGVLGGGAAVITGKF
jgi:hypothetical protein